MDIWKHSYDFLMELDKMKMIERRTKLLHKDRRETDAEHSFHIALMAVVLRELAPEANLLKTIEMLLIHDLVEIDAGDTFAYDAVGNETKKEREHKAAKRIFSMLPAHEGERLHALWLEFEEGTSNEAKFANAIDRIQPILNNIENDGGTWKEYGVSYTQLLKRMEPIRIWNEEVYHDIVHRAKPFFDEGEKKTEA